MTEKKNEIAKVPTSTEGIRDLFKRAEAGDVSTLPAIREILKDPRQIELLGGNLAKTAEKSFIEALGGKSLTFREAMERKLDMMRRELAGPNPTPLERLLVERVVACWLQCQDADVRYAQSTETYVPLKEYSIHRMDRAHRRYLSAMKTLAIVRKLALPALQINIGEKQVNVAGNAPAEPKRIAPSVEASTA